ncbi:MAG: DUF4197 domain-containing protein [bacterium]|nr:DUF4197 domain-containing protein [bacterium]
MKKNRSVLVWGMIVVFSIFAVPAHAAVEDVLASLGGEENVVNGLKEALKVGTGNAIDIVSQLDGFYGNDLIKILMPEKLQKAETLLRKAGMDKLVDDLELSMNRAAEKAASSATELLVGAITEMTIEDALNILQGEENAATMYFQENTSEQLTATFKPIVETAMKEVGVTKLYQTLEDKVTGMVPLGLGDLLDIDLSRYVTDKALGGLFRMLAEEEKKIREDPEARISDLLEQIFK